MEKSDASVVAEVLRETGPWIEDSNLTYSSAAHIAKRAVRLARRAGGDAEYISQHAEMSVLQAVCEAGPSII
jgi:hypothetical protein